ncbi:MAG TPA: ATP-binding protein, partial [Candidatus Ozemobacteraceae bacterium]|nr:ATP-binding protein [Candidatus Ozemobacteraceae bacterium]
PIQVTARFSQTVVEVSIEDPGPGFEYEQIKLKSGKDLEKMLARGVNKGKGWGLAIMQSVSQGLFWNHRGNRITLLFQK